MQAAGDSGGIGMFPASTGLPRVVGQLPPGMSLPGWEQVLNFLGMGMPELVVIFLVAFLVLGPSKSIDMARTTGKVLGDLRRSFNDVIAATARDPEDLHVTYPTPPRPTQDDHPRSRRLAHVARPIRQLGVQPARSDHR